MEVLDRADGDVGEERKHQPFPWGHLWTPSLEPVDNLPTRDRAPPRKTGEGAGGPGLDQKRE